MRIKHDNNFELVARFYGFTDMKLFEGRLLKVIKQMIHHEDMEGTDDANPWYGGCTVKFVMDKKIQMSVAAKMFTEAVCAEKTQLPDQFLDLVLIGDYDCPVCGGKLKKEDIEVKKDHGYFEPPTYEVVGYKVECTNCAYYQLYDYMDRN